MNKKIFAPFFLTALLLSTCTPSYAEKNVSRVAWYTTGTKLVFAFMCGATSVYLGYDSYLIAKKLIGRDSENRLSLFFELARAAKDAILLGIVTISVAKEAIKNFSDDEKKETSLKEVAKKSLDQKPNSRRLADQ